MLHKQEFLSSLQELSAFQLSVQNPHIPSALLLLIGIPLLFKQELDFPQIGPDQHPGKTPTWGSWMRANLSYSGRVECFLRRWGWGRTSFFLCTCIVKVYRTTKFSFSPTDSSHEESTLTANLSVSRSLAKRPENILVLPSLHSAE